MIRKLGRESRMNSVHPSMPGAGSSARWASSSPRVGPILLLISLCACASPGAEKKPAAGDNVAAGPSAGHALDASPSPSAARPTLDAEVPRPQPQAADAEHTAANDAAPRSSSADAAADGGKAAASCSALLGAGSEIRRIQVDGSMREYLLHVPELPSGEARPPLLVDLHGLLTHATFQRASSGFQATADAEGFIVAYPNAVDAAWNIGPCCTPTQSVDDLGFVRALVTELGRSGCIDLGRVYATGVSAGGGLAQQLACRASDMFAAVISADFDLLQETAAACKPTRPIAVLALRSMEDPSMPYAGGEVRPSNGLNVRIHPLGAAASFQRWAELNQCRGAPEDRGSSCQFYAACGAGVEVGLCTRAQTGSVDAAQAWEFLARFRSR